MPNEETYDYVVIGLGSIGSMTLWQLSAMVSPDTKILGIEQFGIVHPHGSYAGESRLFRVAVKEGGELVPLVQQARDLWMELNEISARDVFLPIGALSIGVQGSAPIEATMASIREWNLEHEFLDRDLLKERFPQFEVEDQMVGILDTQGGGIRPELAVASATEEARRLGAEIRTHMPVKSINLETTLDGSERVRISTKDGDIMAKHVIVTTGSWAKDLLPEVGEKIEVTPITLTWMMPRDIKQFLPDQMPVFLYDSDLEDGSHFHIYGAPSLDGYTVKFSEGHDFIPVASVEELVRKVPESDLDEFSNKASNVVPDFYESCPRYSVHHDGFTANGRPIIDTLKGKPITVAVGMSGTGMKFAPVYGQIAAELATTGHSSKRPDSFTSIRD
ncbi:N-methyl-L-tryptophan oxidase [Corynebacterium callunae]|uniref:N-methyl-L-tryptophan oxidase n=1 Tax=Corynebacterium callunae TaxID=1721 RepID=UPI0039828EE8